MLRLKNAILIFVSFIGLSACGDQFTQTPIEFRNHQTDRASGSLEADPNLDLMLDAAESKASPDGLVILKTARSMILNGIVLPGDCWHYINAVYNRASVSEINRATPFKGAKLGPYAATSDVQAGDWLYFINHSYGDIEHSGIFIDWIDIEKREALVMSYPGGNRMLPARYSTYELTSIYNVMRPKPKSAKPQ